MFLDFESNQITLTEGKDENVVKLQNVIDFSLCYRLRNDKFEVPYISLPYLVKACKKVNYPIYFSDSLKKYFSLDKMKRKILEGVKEGTYPLDRPDVMDLFVWLNTFQKRTGCKWAPSPGQIDTAIFGYIGERILIANTIGTGKTFSVNLIANYLREIGEAKKILVLTPASLVSNYVQDYHKFFGKQGIMKIQKERPEKRTELYKLFKSKNDLHMLVTNYEKCLYDFERLMDQDFDIVICDEFHYMKNFLGAKRSINFFEMIKKWNPRYRFPMSGSPIESKLFDLYPVFRFLDGGNILGGQKFFESNFVKYEEVFFKINGMVRREMKPVGFKNESDLKKLIRPYIIRKSLDLPVDLYQQNIEFDPDKDLLDRYKKMRLEFPNVSSRYHGCRQFLCDTSRGNLSVNPKLDKFEEILEQTDQKMIVFSFYRCTIELLQNFLNKKGIKFLTIVGGTGEDPLKIVNKFQDTPDIKCLLCTDAVNYGQNIQEAKIVVNWELPLKPTTLVQRIGRTYRTGQTSDIHVYNFVIKGTVEEDIMEMFNQKQEIIKEVIENLDDKKLKALEKLDAEFNERINKLFIN